MKLYVTSLETAEIIAVYEGRGDILSIALATWDSNDYSIDGCERDPSQVPDSAQILNVGAE